MPQICLICPKDSTFNFRKELIEKLLDRNEVVLISPYGKVIDKYVKMGCRFIGCDIDRRGTSILNDLKLTGNYLKILKRMKPDIVLTYTTKCSIYGGFACRLLRIPLIVNTAGLMQVGEKISRLERFILLLYKIAFKKASCMMYQNTHEQEFVNRTLKNKVPWRLIPGSGVNLDEYTYRPYPADDVITFNYVARIKKIKGIDEFLQCAEKIRSKYDKARFVLYGEYDDENCREMVDEYVKRGIVEYSGNKTDIKPYIEAAHAVIHPSYYEGMTNVVLEHSAMGRVCIGSDIPGVREGIDDGVTGFLVPVRDAEALTNAVEKLMKMSNEQRAAMGAAARKKVEKEFDRAIVVNAYLDEIDRIIGRGTK